MVDQSPESMILRQKARSLTPEEILKPETQQLIDDMFETCGSIAVGLAAPQVGHSIRLLILAPKSRKSFPGSFYEEPIAVINPIILAKSEEKVYGWDGCMSIKNDRGYPRAWFERHRSVEVQFLDWYGNSHTRRLDGFVSRIFQHEFDHLEGVLFTDYVDAKDLVQEDDFNKKMKENA